jgi:outer membrane receptor protein involved in Fe transport
MGRGRRRRHHLRQRAGSRRAPAPDAAGAADDEPSKPQTLANIIVTAQKREQAAIDVPASVTSVDARQLSRNGQTRIQDYSAEIPGLSSTSGRPGQNQVVIRGISTGTAQGAATTGIYLDEAPVGSVNAYTVGSQLVPDIDPSELSRIEVLKGPQGTLYGAGAMGGLMRYVTANPKYDDCPARSRSVAARSPTATTAAWAAST